MKPWELLADTALEKSKNRLKLMRRGDEYSIRVDYTELMNSRAHGSEEALAQLTAQAIRPGSRPNILIGGLGMGYTVRAALNSFPPKAPIFVAELSPELVAWNRTFLAHLAENPLADERVTILSGDVRKLINESTDRYTAIILDVDNGPEGLTLETNHQLYSKRGLMAIKNALKQDGVLAVWSQGPSELFTLRLKECGYSVQVHHVPARPSKPQGPKNTIWIAVRGRR